MRTFVATFKDQYIQEITLNPNTYTFHTGTEVVERDFQVLPDTIIE